MALVRRMGFLSSGPLQFICILLFLVMYAMITFRLAGPQPDCLSVRDFADQLRRYELQLDAAGLLHRLADQPATAAMPPARDEHRERTGDDRRHGPGYEAHAAADTTTRPPSYFVYDTVPHEHLLNSSFAPNVVYYVWCGRRSVSYTHLTLPTIYSV